MNITARNYAAQAARDIDSLALTLQKNGMKRSMLSAKREAEKIRRAVHFAIPDCADILGDNLRGITGQSVRLPYPLITVEYFFPKDQQILTGEGIIAVEKRLIIAEELTGEQIRAVHPRHEDIPEYRDGGIRITYASVMPHTKQWWPIMVGLVVPFLWDTPSNPERLVPLNTSIPGSTPFICFPDATEYPEINAQAAGAMGKRGVQMVLNDVGGEVVNLFELLEALSCKNVTTEPLEVIDPKVNARRIRDGKLPLYETKILVVNTKHADYPNGERRGGSHASPRQHLRRGHIRRLPKGNIWVNSCVVGDPTKGRIEKQYQVTA